MIDVYLSEEHREHWPAIVQSCQADDGNSLLKSRGYALEGCRLSTNNFGHLRCGVGQDVTIQEGATTADLETGDHVFLNLVFSLHCCI